MALQKIDINTPQPNGKFGESTRSANIKHNSNITEVGERLEALEEGTGGAGQAIEELGAELQQETQERLQAVQQESAARSLAVEALQQADHALGERIDAEQIARQQLATTLGQRIIGKNRLINGSMRWWQRGTNFTAPGYSADRWYFNAGGVATPSFSRSPLSPVDYGSECIYFAKVSYGSIADAANHYVVSEQRIENVTTLAGKSVTVTFKVFNSGANGRQIAVELGQNFGAGGSPQVSGIGAAKYSLAAGINTITHTVQIPSIAGKAVGANSALILTLWATGGSNFNARNSSLGAQVGDVHFTQVQLEEGSSASAFDYRPDGLELILCQRFYCKSFPVGTAPATGLAAAAAQNATAWSSSQVRTEVIPFPVEMRATPALLLYTSSDANAQGNGAALWNGAVWNSSAQWGFDVLSSRGFSVNGVFGSGLTVNGSYLARFNWTAEAEM